MAYEPTVWTSGDLVTATKLNKLEQGVANGGDNSFVLHFTNNGNNFTSNETLYDILMAGYDGKTFSIDEGFAISSDASGGAPNFSGGMGSHFVGMNIVMGQEGYTKTAKFKLGVMYCYFDDYGNYIQSLSVFETPNVYGALLDARVADGNVNGNLSREALTEASEGFNVQFVYTDSIQIYPAETT